MTATSAPYGTASTKSGVSGTVSPAMRPIRPEEPRKEMSCAARSAYGLSVPNAVIEHHTSPGCVAADDS